MARYAPTSVQTMVFKAEWYDPRASITRDFIITYHIENETTEIFDKRTNRLFLRRTRVPGVRYEQMFLGNTISVYGRNIRLTAYATEDTEKLLRQHDQMGFVLIKPGAVARSGRILASLEEQNLRVHRLRMVQLKRKEACEFLSRIGQQDSLVSDVEELCTSACVLAVVVGDDALTCVHRAMSTNSDDPAANLTSRDQESCECEARDKSHAHSDVAEEVQASGERRHCPDVYVSADCETFASDIELFFPNDSQGPASSVCMGEDGTCCVVLPHVVTSRRLGRLLESIETSRVLRITGMEMMTLSASQRDKLTSVYRGVLPDFGRLIFQLTSGSLVALELTKTAGSCAMDPEEALRQLSGPSDPQLAVKISPDSLRARFSQDAAANAVYCTVFREQSLVDRNMFFQGFRPFSD